jgi:hypothetical protein
MTGQKDFQGVCFVLVSAKPQTGDTMQSRIRGAYSWGISRSFPRLPSLLVLQTEASSVLPASGDLIL